MCRGNIINLYSHQHSRPDAFLSQSWQPWMESQTELTVEVSGLARRGAVSLGSFRGPKFLRKVRNHSPNDTASHRRSPRTTPSFVSSPQLFIRYSGCWDRLCDLVVRVSGYRYRGLGFDSRHYQIFWVVVGLERGPLSLVRSIEELLE